MNVKVQIIPRMAFVFSALMAMSFGYLQNVLFTQTNYSRNDAEIVFRVVQRAGDAANSKQTGTTKPAKDTQVFEALLRESPKTSGYRNIIHTEDKKIEPNVTKQLGNLFEYGADDSGFSYYWISPQNSRIQSGVLIAGRIVISIFTLIGAMYTIISRRFNPMDRHWAYGAVGTILGFWLHGG